jgi:hypothetical protein
MPSLLGEARVIDDPSLDRSVTLHLRQYQFADLGQNPLVRQPELEQAQQLLAEGQRLTAELMQQPVSQREPLIQTAITNYEGAAAELDRWKSGRREGKIQVSPGSVGELWFTLQKHALDGLSALHQARTRGNHADNVERVVTLRKELVELDYEFDVDEAEHDLARVKLADAYSDRVSLMKTLRCR